MEKANINQAFVNKIICPKGKKRITHCDQDINGLTLEIRSGGYKMYTFRYVDQYGYKHIQKIGSANKISVKKAKKKAAKIVLGKDQALEERINEMVPYLGEFIFDSYFPYLKSWHNESSNKFGNRLLNHYVIPGFRYTPMNKITQQDIVDFHHALHYSEGLSKGNTVRTLLVIRHIYNLALEWEVTGVTSNPAVGVKLFQADNA